MNKAEVIKVAIDNGLGAHSFFLWAATRYIGDYEPEMVDRDYALFCLQDEIPEYVQQYAEFMKRDQT